MSREDKCFKLTCSTGIKTSEHKLSRHAFSLAVERLFVTMEVGLKTEAKFILRKILIC